ncbi:MAG: DUF523 domain-containing protein [Candidatus Lernaella stagnicola]|nr:DUF523 domain-containing protein [Candidatus Lernaella stagnicola]
MPYILQERIRIGISLCQFGAKVRWNHRGWNRIQEIEREMNHFIWTPVCPELNSGLGVTRDPIRLVGGHGDDFWAGNAQIKNRRGLDVSDAMRTGLTATMALLHQAQVEAFVFMEGSPSCGVYRTTLKNRRMGKPPGAFGSLLLKERLFLIPAEDLNSPVKWWDWRRRLHAFVWLKRQELQSKEQIYDIWGHFKFVCQEVNQTRAREIGRQLAAMPKRFSAKFAEEWRGDVLMLLRQPSTIARVAAAMQKHYTHYMKHINPESEPLAPPVSDMSRRKFVAKLHEMEKKAFLEDFAFKGTPVLFRETSRR